MSEEATPEAPIYRIMEEGGDDVTKRHMIICDEGWRTSIVCEGMYLWAAEWLVNLLGRSPYAPGNHS